ncbi:MAG TPA: SufD family Fe-S cluster assembly protein [Thermoplasmata archaeon]|nr:SufD family Fe-S cluster assembly protein [Thermoplasmata archaeon]
MTARRRTGGRGIGLVSVGTEPTDGLVRDLSRRRREPEWMLRLRLKGARHFRAGGVPEWAAFLADVDFGAAVEAGARAEPGPMGPGLGALEESEAAYQGVRAELDARGIRFLRTDAAVRSHPDLVREVFGQAIAPDANPFAALNAALWSGGTFVHVPSGVDVGVALQAEIREDYDGVDPFERTIVVADGGARVEYIEGCTAPVYTPDELHVSGIEVFARPGASVRYVAVQNFAKRIDNLVTKRALVDERASVEWVDANLGSRRTWKSPETVLRGPGASVETYGWGLAGPGQHEDIGGSVLHEASGTRARIVLRGASHGDGSLVLRPRVFADPDVRGASAQVDASSLLRGPSRNETIPVIELQGSDVDLNVVVGARRLSDDELGPERDSKDEALRHAFLAFAEVVTKRIPFEYAIEVNRLAELELGGAVG